MSRKLAAALAILITFAIFGVALAASLWLLGAKSFLAVLSARWFPAVMVVFNSVVVCVLVIVMTLRRKREEKTKIPEDKGLHSASERLRRQLQRGR
jgi:hypothetical protein